MANGYTANPDAVIFKLITHV